jgi:hypothetical protein
MNTVGEALIFRNQATDGKFLPRTLDGKSAKEMFGMDNDYKKFVGHFDQQGDALFYDHPGKIPKDAKLKPDNVAVEGLKRHIAHGKGVKVYEGFVDAPKGCVIKHAGNDHGDTHLAPGRYEVKQVLEYDHLLEESRKVID